MFLALYEYLVSYECFPCGALVSYECFHNIRYATMLSGNGLKTVRCSYNKVHDPLRLTMLSGNGAQIWRMSFMFVYTKDTFYDREVAVVICECFGFENQDSFSIVPV